MISSILKKKLLPASIALAMASGALFSSSVNAIHVNEKGIGQVLMSPIYMAEYGYNTKVSIVNTRTDTAVKVRVALRSHVNSIEFDFVCFLTPADVCQFEIIRGEDGQAYLKSTDDSLLANSPTSASDFKPIFASQCITEVNAQFCKDGALLVKAIDAQLPTHEGGNVEGVSTAGLSNDIVTAFAHPSNADDNEFGHLEVIGAWAVQGSIRFNNVSNAEVNFSDGALQNRILVKQGMSKADLYKIMGSIVPETANGSGVFQSRGRLAAYEADQNEALSFATGRMVGGTCQADPIDTVDALQGSSIVSSANYGQPCNVASNTIITEDVTAIGSGAKIRSTDPRWIRLTGLVEMENSTTGDRMGLRMTALDGDVWDNLTPRGDTITNTSYGLQSLAGSNVSFGHAFDGRLISNPNFDVNTSQVLAVGNGFASSRAGIGTVPTYDNIIEIERALAANSMKFTYEHDDKNKTNLIVTFPTKYRHRSTHSYREDSRCTGNSADGEANGKMICIDNDFEASADVCGTGFTGRYYYPPFRSEPSGAIFRSLSSFDNQEHGVSNVITIDPFSGDFNIGTNTAITDEVNYMFIPSWPFASGWASLGLTAEGGCAYDGVPVLAYVHKNQPTSAGFVNSWLIEMTKNSPRD